MTSTLSARHWQEIAQLWATLAEISPLDHDEALTHLTERLCSLVGGTNLLLVVQRKEESVPDVLGGYRPVLYLNTSGDLERHREIRRQWLESEPDVWKDPILRRVIADAGRMRTFRHRGETDPRVWDRAPVRRLFEAQSLEDRLNGTIPLCDGVEVTFCLGRPRGDKWFDEEAARLLRAALRGLRPLATKIARLHGLLPGQARLNEFERRLKELLLTKAPEAEIARELGVDLTELHLHLQTVYRKVGMTNRLELFEAWLTEPNLSPMWPAELADAKPPSEAQLVVDGVRRMVERSWGDGEFDQASFARQLGISQRTMQRRLKEAGTSFRELLDEMRRERAIILLSTPSLTLTEIAMQLGYGQVSSLNRAVKRWTDKTPGELQEELCRR